MRVRQPFLRAIQLLREAGFVVGVITNNWQPTPASASRMDKLRSKFDFFVESWKSGCRKPDQKIYDIAMQHVRRADSSIRGSQVVFLDDMGQNLKVPRRRHGWHTIKVRSDKDRWVDALLELQKVTGVRLWRSTAKL